MRVLLLWNVVKLPEATHIKRADSPYPHSSQFLKPPPLWVGLCAYFPSSCCNSIGLICTYVDPNCHSHCEFMLASSMLCPEGTVCLYSSTHADARSFLPFPPQWLLHLERESVIWLSNLRLFIQLTLILCIAESLCLKKTSASKLVDDYTAMKAWIELPKLKTDKILHR